MVDPDRPREPVSGNNILETTKQGQTTRAQGQPICLTRPLVEIHEEADVALACTECKERNYITRKNRRNDPDRLELKKFCPRDRRHTVHRETR